MSLAKPIKPGAPEFRVYRPKQHGRTKLLATCFFCGKAITRKGDLERFPVISEGSEVKVPSCHSCFLTVKKRPGLPCLRVKMRVPTRNSRFSSRFRGSTLDKSRRSANLILRGKE